MLTLPASEALSLGDEIKLLVEGAGAVTVTPNSGESFESSPALATPDFLDGGDHGDRSLRCCVIARRATPCSRRSSPEASTDRPDRGVTWTETGAPSDGSEYWDTLAMSADGTHVAAGTENGDIWVSSDSGDTWSDPDVGIEFAAQSLGMSADASLLVAGDGATNGVWILDRLRAELDAGVSSQDAWFVASSTDGTRLVAGSTTPVAASRSLGPTPETTGAGHRRAR